MELKAIPVELSWSTCPVTFEHEKSNRPDASTVEVIGNRIVYLLKLKKPYKSARG